MIISENATALSFYMPVFRLCLRSFLGFARDDIARDGNGENGENSGEYWKIKNNGINLPVNPESRWPGFPP